MNKRFLGLVGLFVLLLTASCDIVEEQEILRQAHHTDGTQTSPKSKKD